MMRLRAFYSHLNTPLSIKNNRLYGYQSKAPVHWGVNATLVYNKLYAQRSKAPVHWGVNATIYKYDRKPMSLRPLCIGV